VYSVVEPSPAILTIATDVVGEIEPAVPEDVDLAAGEDAEVLVFDLRNNEVSELWS